MPAAEQVYQSLGGDGLGAERGGPIEGITLGVQQMLQASQGGLVETLRGR